MCTVALEKGTVREHGDKSAKVTAAVLDSERGGGDIRKVI
jgi:hypothetical protein